LPNAYLLFEGEHHGFRKVESISRGLSAELTFYGKILGFEPATDSRTCRSRTGRPTRS
jgi:hypothetical protein